MDFSKDINTLTSNYVRYYVGLIEEYEQIKERKHPKYRFVKDFFADNGICQQNFHKYRNRFIKNSKDVGFLLPQIRGPKWRSRRIDIDIENKVLELRKNNLNRYEIYAILEGSLKTNTPSVSTIYKILKRNGVNRLVTKNPNKLEEKITIMKESAGELGHIDCYYLGKEVINNSQDKYYLVGLIDDASRVVHVELVNNIKSLTVMFATLRLLNVFSSTYKITFEAIMSDNGAEFSSKNNQENHPFERMLLETNIKHIYTRPYRPQTNGKIERFWKTLYTDLIEGTYFEDIADFQAKLEEYLTYYNHFRIHQGLGNSTPAKLLEKLHRIK